MEINDYLRYFTIVAAGFVVGWLHREYRKRKARKRGRRVTEQTLALLIGYIAGSVVTFILVKCGWD